MRQEPRFRRCRQRWIWCRGKEDARVRHESPSTCGEPAGHLREIPRGFSVSALQPVGELSIVPQAVHPLPQRAQLRRVGGSAACRRAARRGGAAARDEAAAPPAARRGGREAEEPCGKRRVAQRAASEGPFQRDSCRRRTAAPTATPSAQQRRRGARHHAGLDGGIVTLSRRRELLAQRMPTPLLRGCEHAGEGGVPGLEAAEAPRHVPFPATVLHPAPEGHSMFTQPITRSESEIPAAPCNAGALRGREKSEDAPPRIAAPASRRV